MTQIIIQEHNNKNLTDNIIVFCDQNKNLFEYSQKIDSMLDGKISTFLSFQEFGNTLGDIAHLNILEKNKLINVYVLPVDSKEKSLKKFHQAGIKLSNKLHSDKIKVASLISEKIIGKDPLKTFVQALLWSNYEFSEWKSDFKSNKILELSIQVGKSVRKEFQKEISEIETINQCSSTARDLVNRPANIVTPEYLVDEAKKLKKLGVKLEILDVKKLEKQGLNLILNVGKGSTNPPYLIIMKYLGAGNSALTHGLVGKGITFDTGGYSLKPSEAMVSMKSDMAGAAATLGTVKALATLKAPVNIVAAMACAENMVNSKAFKNSDIVKSYSGLNVEVLNTDAEGRLVLADAMSYIIKNNDIDEIIDIATLTGACMVALGAEYAGLMGNNSSVVESLKEAGQKSQEPVWELPMGSEYADLLKSDVADVSNISNSKFAGEITAAEFLHKFTEDVPWAHIDMAGTAFVGKTPGFYSANNVKGATGFGVRLLTQHYLNKVSK